MLERPKKFRRRLATVPRVHARGDASLDAMLALTEVASRQLPVDQVLAELCERIARLLRVEVCSIYLSDVDAELVLRATHGYPQTAVGQVRMRIGEGLTGFAVECMRPVSVARTTTDGRNKAFEGLDEQRFPSLCAVPLVDGGRPIGALVVQRRQPRAFGQREMVLAAAVAPPILFALERARVRSQVRRAEAAEIEADDRHGERPQGVQLVGESAVPGHALGRIVVRRDAAEVAPDHKRNILDERARLGAALARAAEETNQLEEWALRHAPPNSSMLALLSPSRFVLDDARLRERMFENIEGGLSAEAAVERALNEYARVLSAAPDAMLAARAFEIEAHGAQLLGELRGAQTLFSPGCVFATARLTVHESIALVRAHGTAALCTRPARESPGLSVARAFLLPVLSSVAELFRWVTTGDRILIDGATVIVNPSRVDVAGFRKAHRASL